MVREVARNQASESCPHGARDTASERRPNERRKALLTISALAAILIMTVLLTYVIVKIFESSFFAFLLIFYVSWLEIILAVVMCMAIRFRLATVQGKPEEVLADLRRRLRISSYDVNRKRDCLRVKVSGRNAVKIRARESKNGTVITYQADASPAFWCLIIILMIFGHWTAPAGLAIAFLLLYESAAFASDRILPRLTGPPIPAGIRGKSDTRIMIIEGLSEGKRLSSEAYDGMRSNYEDKILLAIAASFLASTCLFFILVREAISDALSNQSASDLIILTGWMLSTVVLSALAWRVLSTRAKPHLSRLAEWNATLETALARETSGICVPETDASALELMMETCRHLPEWMKIRRSAGLSRQPGDWIFIFLTSVLALSFGVPAVLTYHRVGASTEAILLTLLAVGFAFLAILIYHSWRKEQRQEAESTITDWNMRFSRLKEEMETYLGGV